MSVHPNFVKIGNGYYLVDADTGVGLPVPGYFKIGPCMLRKVPAGQ